MSDVAVAALRGRRGQLEATKMKTTTIAIARGVTTCPVKAVKAWLQAAGISEGPLFRPVAKGGRLGAERLTDQSVCKVVKAYAERIGLKATDFGAHSLPTPKPCPRWGLTRA